MTNTTFAGWREWHLQQRSQSIHLPGPLSSFPFRALLMCATRSLSPRRNTPPRCRRRQKARRSCGARSGSSSRRPQRRQWTSTRPSATLSCRIIDTPSLWREDKPRAGVGAVASPPAASARPARSCRGTSICRKRRTRRREALVCVQLAARPFLVCAGVYLWTLP